MQRFWSKVAVGGPDDCWEWQGGKAKGYGRFKLGGQMFLAHRLALKLSGVEVPDDLVVRHRCNNRACCNPNHLLVGTQLENVQDAIAAGTHYWEGLKVRPEPRRGEANEGAKLTRVGIEEARRNIAGGASLRGEARRLGVHHTTLLVALRGETWQTRG